MIKSNGVVYIKNEQLSPGQILVLGYLIIIALGTFLLILPIAAAEGQTTTLLEALFTSTSATAVTGLIVVNTAEHWSRFGQVIIMILIQIGGFGFMTTTTMLFLILRRKVSLRERLIIKEELNSTNLSGVINLTRYIIFLTFGAELIGTLLLYFSFRNILPPARAWFFSLFHAISAFNNAGFDLFGNSLEGYVENTYLNLVITLLFIVGGLGFIVIAELYQKQKLSQLSLHSKLVLAISIFLIIAGTLVIFILEYNNPATIGNLSLKGKLLASFFQGVTPRTAGFNTVRIGYFKDVTLFILIILMFIGASPGSTGGGVKTTTVGTLVLVAYNMASGKEDIDVFGRRLKKKDIYKTLTIVAISLVLISIVTIALTITEEYSFIQIMFEVFSAFGTVGLSTGITSKLSIYGKLFIILTMFIGRVGPFTMAIAIGKKRTKGVRYPEEDILIG